MKPQSKIKNRKSKIQRAGFTLMELLVVIGIITVMLGIGILAFNALTGRKSTAMARNQIAAMLSKARAIAINDKTTQAVSYGIVFFRDPETERTAMAIARRDDTGGGDPDPNDNYKAWTPGVNYQPGDRVVAIIRDDVEGGAVMAVRFRCAIANTANAATRPPTYRPVGTAPPLRNNYWEEVLEGGIGYPDEPLELLPVGVGVQVMVDSSFPNVTATQLWDRYTRVGAIFFDRRGQLDHLPYTITQGSPVGLRLGLTADIPNVAGAQLYSGIGIAIYDQQLFTSAGHIEDDLDPRVLIPGHTAPTAANETAEEQWIDGNANLLTVDRYSGELSQIR